MTNFIKKKQNKFVKFFSDFKAFISKGNILDMAIGVIIGGAFGKIVTSLVNDIIMPLISLAAGGKSIYDWKWVITEGSETVAESAVRYGLFLQSIIDFLIIAFFIFLVLRIIMNFKNRLTKEEDGVTILDKKERKQLIKDFKSQGYSKSDAILLVDKQEAEMSAAEAAKKAAEAETIATTKLIETSEDILKDIRELLKRGQ